MTIVEEREAANRQQTQAPPMLSVVIPTYNEEGNVAELVSQLVAAIPTGVSFEVLFVDDSTDETPHAISDGARTQAVPSTLEHREVAAGGLGGAVLDGVRAARGVWVVVMNGDLQHPPTLVPQLLDRGERTGADLVVATRYANGARNADGTRNADTGSGGGLSSRYRRLVSRTSTLVTKLTFPRLLRNVTDPMSGFFAVRRAALKLDQLRPLDFKIMLELIVRGGLNKIVEVSFEFGDRFSGASKSSLREGVRFLRHLGALRLADSTLNRTLAFGSVGLTGFLPNLAVLWLLTHAFGVHYTTGTLVATQVAILWNFILIDLFIFHGRRRWRWRGRLMSFVLLNNVDLLFRVPLLIVLVEYAALGVLSGTIVTVLIAFAFRFVIPERVIYFVRNPPGRVAEEEP